MGYVFGILIIIVGAFMVIKTEWFVSSFGYSGWAEEKLGGGGTRTMYKLLGIAAILLSLTGMLGEVIIKVFGRMFVIS